MITELKLDESINASEIGVEVSGGVITLLSHVDNYSQKWSAERAAQKVAGVKALAVEIEYCKVQVVEMTQTLPVRQTMYWSGLQIGQKTM